MGDGVRQAETGTQLLSRVEGRPSLMEIEPLLFATEGCPSHGEIVEFYGSEGTGKTEMLCHLISRCILPKSDGGLQVEVIYIDTDYHFDMLRLVTILEHKLSQNTEEIVKQCLARFFLVYCNSSAQLLLTLYSLENMFCSHPSLCLLLIDSISSFYWIDRSNGGENIGKQERNLRKCAELLDKLLKEYKLVLFASTKAIMQKCTSDPGEGSSNSIKQNSSNLDYKPYLCRLWQQVTAHRILFSKESKNDHQIFHLTSCHLKSKNSIKRTFKITESGVQFL
ncbi:hypothetical protein GDO86_012121 [Hymenochirus boettgeri]|uniref:RecA family profile 1 domain-containing protein n=1 Tax=Hymenochirus boettgeri TaxID=247094 RepID=A0A8T2JJE8_9PIPI|nr:hypothetical protein GDO86_012121 [Hymenochirus boettgeri]